MKTKSILLSLLAMASGICVFAQENDDMYFSSKDRAKTNLQGREEVVMASAKGNSSLQTINPSESYSGRNENPDYIAGIKVGSNASTAAPYFTPNYQPTINQSLYSNTCNCNNSYGNNGYSNYGYGSPYSSIYGMGYGGYGMGMGYGMYGMGMGYPMIGMGYGMGMGFGLGYSSMYGMYGYPFMSYGMGYGMMGYGYGMGYYGYPSMVVVNGTETLAPSYGRRPTLTGRTNSTYTTTNARNNTAYFNGTTGRSSSAFRNSVATGNRSSSYYNNAWKQNSGSSSSSRSSAWGNSGSNSSASRSSFWNNSNSGARQSSWGNTGTRSSGFSGGSFGGGRSGGFSGGGGGHGRR